jgi:hypothetical protein
MTDNAPDHAQSYLKSLGYCLKTVPEDLHPLVEKLIHDVLVVRGAAAEAQSLAERQVGDHQAALEKVRYARNQYKSSLVIISLHCNE